MKKCRLIRRTGEVEEILAVPTPQELAEAKRLQQIPRYPADGETDLRREEAGHGASGQDDRGVVPLLLHEAHEAAKRPAFLSFVDAENAAAVTGEPILGGEVPLEVGEVPASVEVVGCAPILFEVQVEHLPAEPGSERLHQGRLADLACSLQHSYVGVRIGAGEVAVIYWGLSHRGTPLMDVAHMVERFDESLCFSRVNH